MSNNQYNANQNGTQFQAPQGGYPQPGQPQQWQQPQGYAQAPQAAPPQQFGVQQHQLQAGPAPTGPSPAQSDAAALFANMGNVKSSGGSPFFVPGNYVLLLKKALIQESQQQGKGKYFVAEFDIHWSDNPERPTGSQVSCIWFFNKGEVVLANIKNLVSAVMQVPDSAVGMQESVNFVAGDGTAYAGYPVKARAFQTTTRAGNPFTRVIFEPAPQQQQQQQQ